MIRDCSCLMSIKKTNLESFTGTIPAHVSEEDEGVIVTADQEQPNPSLPRKDGKRLLSFLALSSPCKFTRKWRHSLALDELFPDRFNEQMRQLMVKIDCLRDRHHYKKCRAPTTPWMCVGKVQHHVGQFCLPEKEKLLTPDRTGIRR